MPRTRLPLDYPVNRLILRVGLVLASWMPLETPCWDPAARQEYEGRLAAYLGLEQAITERLLTGYRFYWNDEGRVATARLVPHPRVRRQPGIAAMKRVFLPPRP